ncbi:efflux RND transporter periplasmic adaptor subunit [Methylomonas sp. MgM2]
MRKILFGFLLAGSLNASAENPQIQITPEQIDNLAVKIGPVQVSQEIPILSAPAEVVVPADREMLISSPQPGFLRQLHANIGDRVKQGQVLAQINSPELVVLQQQFLTARSALNLAGFQHRRDQKLLQEGVIAERRWQETQALYNNKVAIANESRDLLSIAGMSDTEIAKLEKTHKLNMSLLVRAPMDGVILDRLVKLGSRLDTQAPLYRIADLSKLWLQINIPQERISDVEIGDRVKIPDYAGSAKISLLGQSVDPANQTVLARAVITDKAEKLRVGQHLNVQIMQAGGETGFRVPNSAIAQNAGRSYIFVRNAGGFAVTEVKVIGRQDQGALITGPLTPGQSIAVEGSVALKANWLGMGEDK